MPASKGRKKSGKEPAEGYRIVHVLKDCIGCGACSAISRNWKAKGDKFVPKNTALSRLGKELEAAQSCPENCIHLFAGKKKLI